MDRNHPDHLREHEAEAHVGGICFKTGPPRRTGVELEWFVRDHRDPAAAVPPERLDAALAPLEHSGGLPHGSTVTREPGGQVELSSLPAPALTDCVTATADDLAVLARTLHSAGLTLDGTGLEPYRSPSRVLDHPRYRAMEAYFDRAGPWGRVMMCATASIQVSLDAGDESAGVSGYRHRWRLAHRLGPVLVAAFANSPLWRGRPTGWRSARQAVWARMDPGRTRPPPPWAGDPRTAWVRYALDAELLCVRRGAPRPWTAPPGLAFRDWLHGRRSPRTARRVRRPPTLADLDYHLSTLFPPVRPRGWLELRMIDAQQPDCWPVALAVAATLLDDPVAADAAYAATGRLCCGSKETALPPPSVWLRAARHGPADPQLGAAVLDCFDAVESALARRGAPAAALRAAVAGFAARYADRGRCPADDWLDRFGAGHAGSSMRSGSRRAAPWPALGRPAAPLRGTRVDLPSS